MVVAFVLVVLVAFVLVGLGWPLGELVVVGSLGEAERCVCLDAGQTESHPLKRDPYFIYFL